VDSALVAPTVAAALAVREGGRPLVARLRDAYLEPWARRSSRQELDRAAALASWLGMLGRALAWRASYETANVDERIDCAEGVVGWLQDFEAAAPDGATGP
jgi:hypothetical protein